MVNRRTIGIIIIVVAFIIMLAIIYFLFFYNFNKNQPTGQPSQPTAGQQPAKIITQPLNKIINLTPPTKVELNQDDLKRRAAAFSERFGSYSNQSNYQNMQDLKIFMSDKLQAWTDNFIQTEIAKQSDKSVYSGITTKAISQKIETFDDAQGAAKVMVITQRREIFASTTTPSTYSQNIELTFIKQAGVWKVDEATWQSKGK